MIIRIEFAHGLGCLQSVAVPIYVYEYIEDGYESLFYDLLPLDEVVIMDEQIFIAFRYPLTEKTLLPFANKGGFTRRLLLKSIFEGYEKIYEGEFGDLDLYYAMYDSQTKVLKLDVDS